MTRKKKFLIFLVLLAIIFICIYSLSVVNRYFNHNEYYFEKTLISSNAKEIKYDENYAVNVAIIIYKQLYGKEYLYDDFTVDDTGRFGSLCWNVMLYKPFNGVLDETPRGLVIDKKNGAIVMNLGE